MKEDLEQYNGRPIGVLRGFIYGTFQGYYCTNCNYGLYEELKYKTRYCPKCKSLIDWEKDN